MKQIIYTVDDTKELEKSADVEFEGDFKQEEINALMHVLSVHARQKDMCIEYMVNNILSDEEAENLIAVLLQRYAEQRGIDEAMASTPLN